MTFRRDGKSEDREHREWEAWKETNAGLLVRCGLPPGVLRSRRDWEYLLRHGYWCDDGYGAHVNKVDFDLGELSSAQAAAFRELLTKTLSDKQKRRGSAGWHFVSPPPGETSAGSG